MNLANFHSVPLFLGVVIQIGGFGFHQEGEVAKLPSNMRMKLPSALPKKFKPFPVWEK